MSASKKRSTLTQNGNSIAEELEKECDYIDDENDVSHQLCVLSSASLFVDETTTSIV